MSSYLKETISQEEAKKKAIERVTDKLNIRSTLISMFGLFIASTAKIGLLLTTEGLSMDRDKLFNLVIVFLISLIGTAVFLAAIFVEAKQTAAINHTTSINSQIQAQTASHTAMLRIAHADTVSDLETRITKSMTEIPSQRDCDLMTNKINLKIDEIKLNVKKLMDAANNKKE